MASVFSVARSSHASQFQCFSVGQVRLHSEDQTNLSVDLKGFLAEVRHGLHG